ncbi:MAG: chorismate synthase [Myxococcales bacterium]|nr:chorismate synthase [Myxococcales bacterium]MCB9715581.1 chorismate synthase [Myxococcales bacterium]
MAGNAFGERFRVTTFGESHGGVVGVVVDGCPAGHPFPRERIAAQLARRRPGQGRLSSARREPDEVEVGSGIDPESGLTLGTPIVMWVRNTDAKSQHYDELRELYRPSHADYTYDARYGLRFVAGGGRASARETVGRVAAGALAEDLLEASHGIEIVAWVDRVHEVAAPAVDPEAITREQVDRSEVRCPDPEAAARMTAAIEAARADRDTVGGVLRCVARGVPPGLGEPVFDKLSAALAGAMMSLPASRGFELGEGFAAVGMRGSEHNDAFVPDPQRQASTDGIRTRTNRSGGIQGGLSNGETVRFAVAFKPVATIFKPQDTVDRQGRAATYTARGRHDPCVLPRAVPMVEAMTALVLCDHLLRRLGARAEELGR